MLNELTRSSAPFTSVASAGIHFPISGVEELRIRDRSGVYRTFYCKKSRRGILILHAFAKKTRKTPTYELDIARLRLKEMLHEEEK